MLNDTQKELCKTSIDFISSSLDQLVEVSAQNSHALNSTFLALRLSLKYDEATLKIYLEKIYPQEKHDEFRQLFMEINELIFHRNPEHPFVKAICDERLTTLPKSSTLRAEYLQAMQREFALMIKKELTDYLIQSKERKQYDDDGVRRMAAQLKKLTQAEIEPRYRAGGVTPSAP
jgi:hypothetical protein